MVSARHDTVNQLESSQHAWNGRPSDLGSQLYKVARHYDYDEMANVSCVHAGHINTSRFFLEQTDQKNLRHNLFLKMFLARTYAL